MVLVASIAVIAGAVVVAMRPPEWWERANVARLIDSLEAESLENMILAECSRIRPSRAEPPDDEMTYVSDEWFVEIAQSSANAWIAVRFPKWIENQNKSAQITKGIETARVKFFPRGARIGLPLQVGALNVLGSLQIGVDDNAEGGTVVSEVNAFVGSLPVPDRIIGLCMDESMNELTDRDRINRAIDKLPTIRLQDGRRVRVLYVRFEDELMRVYCRTEK